MTAIVDRQTLEAAIANMLNRRDLDAAVPGFIQSGDEILRLELEVGRGHEPNPAYRDPLPALGAAATDTTWLMGLHPTIYLYASLIQSAPFLKDDQRVATWRGLYGTHREAINQEARRKPDEDIVVSHGFNTQESCR